MSQIICTVDVVLLTIRDSCLMVAAIERENAPHEGQLALPGGYVHTDLDANAYNAAIRVLAAKAGITPPYLEQLLTFSGPTRDPRGWSLSVAHYALVPVELIEQANQPGLRLLAVSGPLGLPFDHDLIVQRRSNVCATRASTRHCRAFWLASRSPCRSCSAFMKY